MTNERYSRAWLFVAAALFIADLFLHLPITDVCDALVKRYGFFPFDGFVRRGFEAMGAACLCGAWMWPRDRTVAGIAALTLMATVVGAQELISRRRALLIACAALGAAIVLAPPMVGPFFDVTPGGRRFHRMPAPEAIAVASALWYGVRYLAGRARPEGSPNRLIA